MKRQLLIGLFLLAAPATALAFDFTLKLEPSLAVPVTNPQSQVYSVGGGATVKALAALGRYVDAGAALGVIGLPAQGQGDAGSAWMGGGGVRAKRPHDAEGGRHGLYGISPWVDFDALYVRTEGFNRFGFDFGAGLAVPIGQKRTFWLGPFVRYFQIVQPNTAGFDNRDAKIFLVGLSGEVDGNIGRHAPVERVEIVAVRECPPNKCPPLVATLADRDGDGVPDRFDHCPDAPGPIDGPGEAGCPVYKKLIIKKTHLELQEKILFAWDQATIHSDSFPLLDEVVTALKDNKTFHIKVDGHTDNTGGFEHNQRLSEGRAAAVVAYLVSHGVAASRLNSKGFSSSEPADTNTTAAGRENNRRVEFVVELALVGHGGGK